MIPGLGTAGILGQYAISGAKLLAVAEAAEKFKDLQATINIKIDAANFIKDNITGK
jgi:hypothetical protein